MNDKHELSKDAVIFRTVFGDEKGNPVVNIAKAKKVLKDNRIKAKQSVIKTMDLPFIPKKDATIIARLLYRGMPQKILNLIPGKPFKPLPIVVMAKVEKRI